MKISLITLVMISLIPLQTWSMNQVSKESMDSIQEQGGRSRKESFVEQTRKRPYQMLKRDVQVVLYRLHRQQQELFCRVEYDSQQDTIREMCSKDENRLESIFAE
ncbi:MAG: hypothetical protein CM15mP66_13220 [Pseudomonadota bacterium]|nr:MAG: hypothetical protein CM15mP66_13220 [Pseudomonadota bacterium]